MNRNQIVTGGFSNPESEQLYTSGWPHDPDAAELHDSGLQCGGCSYYAEFNSRFGLCRHQDSRHFLETVSQRFTCALTAQIGWGYNSQADASGE